MLLDQKKGFNSNRQENLPESVKRPRKSRITIMIIRGFGKVSTFNFSHRILLFSIVFFLLYFIVSIFFIQGYLRQRQANLDLDENLRRMEKRELERERALYKNRQQTDKLKAMIQDLEKQQAKMPESSNNYNVTKEDTEFSKAKITEDKKQEEKGLKIVDVEDISIKKEDGKLTVDFKLVKKASGGNPLRGYVHVIAVGQKPDNKNRWVYPEDKAAQNGNALDFRQGSTFRIQRFKRIKEEFIINPGSEAPAAIKIMVYDKSGTQLLEKIV